MRCGRVPAQGWAHAGAGVARCVGYGGVTGARGVFAADVRLPWHAAHRAAPGDEAGHWHGERQPTRAGAGRACLPCPLHPCPGGCDRSRGCGCLRQQFPPPRVLTPLRCAPPAGPPLQRHRRQLDAPAHAVCLPGCASRPMTHSRGSRPPLQPPARHAPRACGATVQMLTAVPCGGARAGCG